MAAKMKKAPRKKKRTISEATRAALARGRAKLAAKRKPAAKKKAAKRKPAAKKRPSTTTVVMVAPKPKRKKTIIQKSTSGGTMAKRKRSVKKVASGARRKAGAFIRQSDATNMLKNAGLAIAGGIGAGFLANKMPIADKRIKSALPIVAGIVLSGTLGRKNRMVKGVAEGMVILGAVSLFKSLAPNVPFLAGDTQYFIPAGLPYNPQGQLPYDENMGQTVRMGEVVNMGMDEYYSPADI